jgi:proteic killer suppression protein
MNIIFADKKLEKYAQDYSLAQRKLGSIQAKLYHQRLNDLYDADSFAVLPHLPGHHHPLSENRAGQWACSLEQPSRLVYEPIIPVELEGSKEQILLSSLKDLSVLEITDYHEKKNKR